MDTQKWQAFLSDPELNNSDYHKPDGQYLLGKIVHDVLHCLNMSDKCFELLAQENPEIIQLHSAWLVETRSFIQSFISDITAFGQYVTDLPSESREWPFLIEKIGQRLDSIPNFVEVFARDAEKVDITDDAVISLLLSLLRGLSAIVVDIQSQQYKQLLMTMKYHEN